MQTQQVTAHVAGSIKIAANQLSDKAARELTRLLEVDNPDYLSAKRRGIRRPSAPSKISFVDARPGGWTVPRGAVTEVQMAAAVDRKSVHFVDKREFHPAPYIHRIPDSWGAGAQMRDYQALAARALASRKQGLIVVPCGGGKTLIALAAGARAGQRTLVLVPTKDLVEQWADDAAEQLVKPDGSPIDPGTWGGGKERFGEHITVATTDTAYANADRLSSLGFGTVIVDEAHHVPAKTLWGVVSNLPAAYRFGATATPVRVDGLGDAIQLAVGSTLYQTTLGELMERGFLMRAKVFRLDHKLKESWRCSSYEDVLQAIQRDTMRQMMIARNVVDLVKRGRSVLVLAFRTAICRQIAECCASLGVEPLVVIGKTAKKARKAAITAMKEGSRRLMLSTTIADEGLNVPRLDYLVQALPQSARSRTAQRIGRIMRTFPGKPQPILADVVDTHEITLRQWAKRRAAYKAEAAAEIIEQGHTLTHFADTTSDKQRRIFNG